MIFLERPADIIQFVGKEIGTSDWLQITQERIDGFAAITGDDQWIHVDVARATKEMPQGRTIAHGFLTLSLIPFLVRSVYQIKERGRGVNYGSNRVRYVSPVLVESRVRLRQTIKGAEPIQGAIKITSDCVVEVEGHERPALIAEFLMAVYDK